jgi:transcriptional regulator with XRE-family HTH domain
MLDELSLIGRAIREKRLEKGWTQEDLANSSGLHPSYVGGIERGQRNLGLINFFKIAKALCVHPADLLVHIKK